MCQVVQCVGGLLSEASSHCFTVVAMVEKWRFIPCCCHRNRSTVFQIMHSPFPDLITCSDLFALIQGLIKLHKFYTMVWSDWLYTLMWSHSLLNEGFGPLFCLFVCLFGSVVGSACLNIAYIKHGGFSVGVVLKVFLVPSLEKCGADMVVLDLSHHYPYDTCARR